MRNGLPWAARRPGSIADAPSAASLPRNSRRADIVLSPLSVPLEKYPIMVRMKSLAWLWLASLLAAPAWAQDPAAAYPVRAIRVIVPFPAGGAADALPRIVGERLAAKWGQPVVVENRVGASGSIGAEAVWRAEPDGYTLLATPPAPLVINPSLYVRLAYDPTQFVPVPGLAALLAGEVEVMFDNLGVTVQHVRSGRLRALAVGSERRVAALPDVPAMAEFYPGFTSVAWFSVSAPPKTGSAIADKLSRAIAETLNEPAVATRLAELSAEPIGSTPAAMAALMKDDAERWRAVIRTAGIKAE